MKKREEGYCATVFLNNTSGLTCQSGDFKAQCTLSWEKGRECNRRKERDTRMRSGLLERMRIFVCIKSIYAPSMIYKPIRPPFWGKQNALLQEVFSFFWFLCFLLLSHLVSIQTLSVYFCSASSGIGHTNLLSVPPSICSYTPPSSCVIWEQSPEEVSLLLLPKQRKQNKQT